MLIVRVLESASDLLVYLNLPKNGYLISYFTFAGQISIFKYQIEKFRKSQLIVDNISI